MSQKHSTICDNCGGETAEPKGQGWSRWNVHPWESVAPPLEDEPDPAAWLLRDLCPKCADKFRAWARGELKIVFRRPKGRER